MVIKTDFIEGRLPSNYEKAANKFHEFKSRVVTSLTFICCQAHHSQKRITNSIIETVASVTHKIARAVFGIAQFTGLQKNTNEENRNLIAIQNTLDQATTECAELTGRLEKIKQLIKEKQQEIVRLKQNNL